MSLFGLSSDYFTFFLIQILKSQVIFSLKCTLAFFMQTKYKMIPFSLCMQCAVLFISLLAHSCVH